MSQKKMIMEVVIPVPRKRPRVDDAESYRVGVLATRAIRSKRELEQGIKCRTDGLLALPLEIFTEIVGWSYPGDLLALSRTTKMFRRHLMQRSAKFMWQRAETNLHHARGLPMCPSLMTEPAYAALLFTKNCTACGKQTICRPDLYLYVRLCTECRDTKIAHIDEFSGMLVDLVPCSPMIGPQDYRDGSSGSDTDADDDISTLSVYLYVEEARRTEAKWQRLRGSEDFAALDEWVSSRVSALEALLRHGVELYNFMENQRYNKTKNRVKKKRRQAIRAKAAAEFLLDPEEFELIHYSMEVMWRTHIDQPKPLTKLGWKSLCPVLETIYRTSLLAGCEDDMAEFAQEDWDRLASQLIELPRQSTGFESIAAALGVGTTASSSPAAATRLFFESVLAPYPNLSDVMGLETGIPFVWNWRDNFACRTMVAEIKLDRYASRHQQGLQEWREQVVEQLGKIALDSWPELGKNDLILMVKGSSEPTVKLSWTERRLLRADCVFKASKKHPLYHKLVIGSSYPIPLPLFFPDLLITRGEGPWNREYVHAYTDARVIAQALLKDMGMPDAAHPELKVMGSRFVCECCEEKKTREWSGIIGHFLEQQQREALEDNHRHETDRAKVRVVSAEQAGELPDLCTFVPSTDVPCMTRRFRIKM